MTDRIAALASDLVAAAESAQPPLEYQDDEDTTVSTSTGWAIQNLQSADWTLGRLGDLRAEKEHVLAAYKEALRRLEARRDQLLDRAERGIRFFESKIAQFAESNRDAILGGGAKKSRNFFHGIIGWRKRAPRLVVVDEPALVAWLQSQPDDRLYRVKIAPDMAALQENFKTKGEIPPGMELVAEYEKLYIEPVNTGSDLLRKP